MESGPIDGKMGIFTQVNSLMEQESIEWPNFYASNQSFTIWVKNY